MKQRFSEEQIIGFIKQQEPGITFKALYQEHGFSPATFYKRKSKYNGLDESETKRLKALEQVKHKHGLPQCIKVDNGSEFASLVLRQWCKDNGITFCTFS